MSPFVIFRGVFIAVLLLLFALEFVADVHWGWYAGVIFIYVGMLFKGSSAMSTNFFVKAHTTPSRADNEIAITFDDGPSANTPNVLEVLKQYGAKASFFCIGQQIEQHWNEARLISTSGHLTGNHSYTHHKLFSFFNAHHIVEEIKKANALITEVTGKKTSYFRPPYGVTNPAIAKAVRKTNMQVMGWNIRSFDTSIKDAEKVKERVISGIKPGSVILLHDPLPNTLPILEAILQYASEKKYKCVTVDQIFDLSGS